MLKRFLIFLTLVASGGSLLANVYYVNQGIKYHIGDNHYRKSEDSAFLDAYPVVGLEWIQAFKVDRPDTVKVHIDNLWGVDDCPYCLVLVSIDSHDMGRLSSENNHEPFDTLEPLAFHVLPGHIYFLKIASHVIDGQADDLAFEGVRVETDKASVTFLKPGPVIKGPDEPMPKVFSAPEPPRDPCGGAGNQKVWLEPEYKSQGWMPLGTEAPFGEEKTSAASLAPGDFVQCFMKLDQVDADSSVGQEFEILLGPDQNGWVFGFRPGLDRPSHGNVKIDGRYSAPAFGMSMWKRGGWNDVRVARCIDGTARIFINGQQLGQPLELPDPLPAILRFKALGLRAKVSENEF